MRPTYEQQHDIDNQAEMAQRIMRHMRFDEMEDQGKYAVIDYRAVRDGKTAAWIECKARGYTWEWYERRGTVLLSREKVRTGLSRSQRDDVPFGFAVRDPTTMEIRMYYVKMPLSATERSFKVEAGGRRDRGDAADIEPCVWIPTNRFAMRFRLLRS